MNASMKKSHPRPYGDPETQYLREVRTYDDRKGSPWLVQGSGTNYRAVLSRLIAEAGGGLVTGNQSDIIYTIEDLKKAISEGKPFCQVLCFNESSISAQPCGYDKNDNMYALVPNTWGEDVPERMFSLRTWLLQYTPALDDTLSWSVTLQRVRFVNKVLVPPTGAKGEHLKRLLGDAAMASAILGGHQTAVLQPMTPQPTIDQGSMWHWKDCQWMHGGLGFPESGVEDYADYQPKDRLALCEPWQFNGNGGYSFTDGVRTGNEYGGWLHPVEMPKDAARIFLCVTKVSVLRLCDVGEAGAAKLGFLSAEKMVKAILDTYPSCTVGSWFWMTEFERISKEDALEEV